MKVFVLLFITVFLASCSANKVYKIPESLVIDGDDIKLEIVSLVSGSRDTNYILSVGITNKTDKITNFDSSDIELIDTVSGVSMYSISKNSSEISLSFYSTNIITATDISPHRKISGYILFPTGYEKAGSDELKILYNNKEYFFR